MCLGSPTAAICSEFCEVDQDCEQGAICAIGIVDSTQTPIPGVTTCSSLCNPVNGTVCPSGMSCQWSLEEMGQMRAFAFCDEAGAGLGGATCTTNSDCAPNHGCYTSNGVSQCYQHCDVFNPACPSIQICQDALGSPTVNGVTIGVCL